MARPRFLLVARTAAARRPWLWWLDAVQLPEPRDGTDPAAADGAGSAGLAEGVAWRLSGGNNRELGRSALVHRDAAACIASVVRLQTGLARAEPVVILNELTGLWGWRIDLDAEPVAASARLYPRRREATYSATQFVAAAEFATVTTEVMRVERTGRAYATPRTQVRRPAWPGNPGNPGSRAVGRPAAPDDPAPGPPGPAAPSGPPPPGAALPTFTVAMSGVHAGVHGDRQGAARVSPPTAIPPQGAGRDRMTGTGEGRRG